MWTSFWKLCSDKNKGEHHHVRIRPQTRKKKCHRGQTKDRRQSDQPFLHPEKRGSYSPFPEQNVFLSDVFPFVSSPFLRTRRVVKFHPHKIYLQAIYYSTVAGLSPQPSLSRIHEWKGLHLCVMQEWKTWNKNKKDPIVFRKMFEDEQTGFSRSNF